MKLLNFLLRKKPDRTEEIAELEVAIINEQANAFSAEMELRKSLRFAEKVNAKYRPSLAARALGRGNG